MKASSKPNTSIGGSDATSRCLAPEVTEVGVFGKVVDAVENEDLVGLFGLDELGDVLIGITHIQQDHLAEALGKERRKAVAEAVLDDDDRALVGVLVVNDGLGMVAVDKDGIFVVLGRVLIEEQRILLLDDLSAVADLNVDVAFLVVRVLPDFQRVGRREPKTALGVGGAVEVSELFYLKALLRLGDKTKDLAVFAVGQI